jgi:hypothetical protein
MCWVHIHLFIVLNAGKYTFLSLFLAVTLEAFDTSDEGPPPTGYPPEPVKKIKKSNIWYV